MSAKEKPKGLPPHVVSLLAQADQRNGLPAGTMASVMQQEVGGQLEKYLGDPTAYHYATGSDGRRVAPQSGKVSTAFGPFGILESTAADPGYGVKPLANKSLDEQVRFAADYLAARSKAGGGLTAGLAAQQVAARMGGDRGALAAPSPAPLPVVAQAASTQEVVPNSGTNVPETSTRPAPIPAVQQALAPELVPDAWQAFLQSMPGRAQPVDVASIDYGNPQPTMQLPQFQFQPVANLRPNFEAFSSWKRRAA